MDQPWQCVIVGGGPAGMMAGLLLARSGVRVLVLEKHGDFLRDFRGDTVHPSTLELLSDLGLMQKFLATGLSKVTGAKIPDARGREVTVLDLAALKHPFPYIAMAPQWEFLNLLAQAATEEENFELRMNCEATELLVDDGQVTGVRYQGPDGEQEIRALLTIAADGRWSAIREQAELPVKEFRVPIDVWWFRVPGTHHVRESLLPVFAPGRVYILIPRVGYVQAAMLLLKGQDAVQRQRGIEKFRAEISHAVPDLEEGVRELALEDLKLLDVHVNLAHRWWRKGLLCIGDAAHAMSPVGGVGVNLAVQDAVCAARLLAGPLAANRVSDRDVAAVQRRRMLPTRVTQMVQRIMHVGLRRLLGQDVSVRLPAPLAWLFESVPVLARIPARLLGVGLLRERPPAAAREASKGPVNR
ncbi:FAD-dependent oxidoreductase [Glutamicibacter sp. MNS18]|uniref:FAD-dependent oxidoreductase n=1 Tax=Glutamicibacter sp. MNS18 TaxID=2989817 RepID=UPI00223603C5|nr:FAD-dependent oxidoreductase [Glutamicibacter sp. MNS18]MCW4464714.1 FAD-dependent oxidoreductase [Glutamicibacter sp. MNS18]